MTGALKLALKHAWFHRTRTFLLVFSLGIGFSIPIAMRWVTSGLQEILTHRASLTPLLVGSRGSEIDLTLSSLYFHPHEQTPIPFRSVEDIEENDLVDAIPLLLGHSASSFPIVGTSLEYFQFRDLKIENGSLPRRLGDCVLGAEVAEQLKLAPDDSVLSDANGFLNPVGDLPLKMRVTGVLPRNNSPDDRAIFVDIKTTWLLQGIGHGHMDESKVHDDQVLSKNNEGTTLGANVQQFMEVTDENWKSFHFHGSQRKFPVSSILVYPRSSRDGIIWEGRFQDHEKLQVVTPLKVVNELIALLINIRQFVDFVVLLLGLTTGLLLVLLGSLSLQLRSQEMETFYALGASRFLRLQLISFDFLLIVLFSIPVILLSAWGLSAIGQPLLLEILF